MSHTPESGERPYGGPRARADDFASGESSTERESLVLNRQDVERAVVRMAHEIVERNRNVDGIHIIGIQRGGVWLAESLGACLRSIAPDATIEVGAVDVSLFRDDIALRPVSAVSTSRIAGDLTGATVILVDDVLFTGRTVRAALDALTQFGRPERVQLAALIDRGHREIPIRADYVGKNLPTSRTAEVLVDEIGVRIAEGAGK